jgi:hypothetical protein
MKNKLAIYTCIINDPSTFGVTENYDSLKSPSIVESNIDYICFTNNPEIKSDLYQIRYVDNSMFWKDSAVKTQRRIKISPHIFLKEYDQSIWIDGHITLKKKIYDTAQELFDSSSSFICRRHPSRDCVYEEAELLKKIKKDRKETISKQMLRYEKEGLPKKNGLIASGIMLRKHHEPSVVDCMNLWWKELSKNSHRDQISFAYASWKQSTPYSEFGEDFFNSFFQQGHHRIKNGKIRKNY